MYGRESRAVRQGEVLVYKGRLCILCGVDPASVFPRCAELEDAETRERQWVALEEIEPESREASSSRF